MATVINCDQTGIELQNGDQRTGKRNQSYLTVRGGSLYYQHEGGGYDELGERGRTYAFADADALAEWVEKEVERVEELQASEGPIWHRKSFGDETGIYRER